MKTVVSKTGVEVLYPCSVELLNDEEVLDCEFKSDHTGKELMDYVCDTLNLQEKDYWGLKFLDQFDQRHWLDLNVLIRTQVKNMTCPVKFSFRVKVYPPEPYKLTDTEAKTQIFLQLRLDLLAGRLSCGHSKDASLLLALLLQHIYGDYDPNCHAGHYIKDIYLLDQTYAVETKAMEIHQRHLNGLSRVQTEDLFLRMSSQLEKYGVDPYLVEDEDERRMTLWINYKGIMTYINAQTVHHLEWMNICKIVQEKNKLLIYMMSGDLIVFICFTDAECSYIYQGAIDHLVIFTSTSSRSTIGMIGSEPEELHDDIRSRFSGTVYDTIMEDCYCYEQPSDTDIDRLELKKSEWTFSTPSTWHIAIGITIVTLALQIYSLLNFNESRYGFFHQLFNKLNFY